MDHDHPDPTPRLTHHARARCAEMRISTMVAKRIVQRPTMTYPGKRGCCVATSTEFPAYAVVYQPGTAEDPPPVIVTVVFRETRQYVRQGATYVIQENQP